MPKTPEKAQFREVCTNSDAIRCMRILNNILRHAQHGSSLYGAGGLLDVFGSRLTTRSIFAPNFPVPVRSRSARNGESAKSTENARNT